jgi:hypothetical protein
VRGELEIVKKWKVEISEAIFDEKDEIKLGHEAFEEYVEEGPLASGKLYVAELFDSFAGADIATQVGQEVFERKEEEYQGRPDVCGSYLQHLIISYIKGKWEDWKERVLIRQVAYGRFPEFSTFVYFKHQEDMSTFLKEIRNYVLEKFKA